MSASNKVSATRLNLVNFLLSYKDLSNKLCKLSYLIRNVHNCFMLLMAFKSYIHVHPNSVIRIQYLV